MALALRSLHDLPNSDLTIDRRYPLGDKPQTQPSSLGINLTAFNAAVITLTGRPQNTPISINYRTYLTGASASTATLSVNASSGVLGNWLISGSNLTNTASTPGSGALVVSATDGVTTVAFPVQGWSILAPIQQTKLKWNPSAFFWCNSIANSGLNAYLAAMDRLFKNGANPTVNGYEVMLNWGTFEGAQGDYSAGFALVDALLARLASYTPQRRLYLTLYQTSSFNQGNPYLDGFAPTYLRNVAYGPISGDNQGGVFSGANGAMPLFWTPAVAARLLALVQAYGARYDSNPLVERFDPFAELSISSALYPYNESQFLSMWTTFAPALRAAWPTTLLLFRPTFIQEANQQSFQSIAIANGISIGDFDCFGEPPANVGKYIWGSTAYRGRDNNGNIVSGWPNRVGQADFHCLIGTDELGPRATLSNPNPTSLPAREGSGLWADYTGQAAKQMASHVGFADNFGTGPNLNRTQSTSAAGAGPAHPNLLDQLATYTVPQLNYPPLLPQ